MASPKTKPIFSYRPPLGGGKGPSRTPPPPFSLSHTHTPLHPPSTAHLMVVDLGPAQVLLLHQSSCRCLAGDHRSGRFTCIAGARNFLKLYRNDNQENRGLTATKTHHTALLKYSNQGCVITHHIIYMDRGHVIDCHRRCLVYNWL